MESILKIIYEKTIKNKILDVKDIEKILELLIVDKSLNNYILNMNVQPIRSNNLASYSNYTITIYIENINQMIKNIETNILSTDIFEIMLYKNLSILQILLHEVEHAYQQKIAYIEDNFEAFIIRLSYLINSDNNEQLYEYSPEERLAEIKSFEEIIKMMNYLSRKLMVLPEILNTERLKRLLNGYHYMNDSINVPIIDYFILGNRRDLIDVFDLPNDIQNKFVLYERLKYGFPISIDEYEASMKKLVLSLNKSFRNRINIVKNS